MITLPTDVATRNIGVQGVGEVDPDSGLVTQTEPGNLAACKSQRASGANARSMLTKPNSEKTVEGVSDALGLKEKCKKKARAFAELEMSDSDGIMVGVSPFAIGGGAIATTSTSNTNDAEMVEEGCGQFAASLATISNETASISCTLNSAMTGKEVTVDSSSAIIIRTKRPSLRAQQLIQQTVLAMNNTLNDAIQKDPHPAVYEDRELAKYTLKINADNVSEARQALQDYGKLFTINAPLRNSTLDIHLNSSMKMKTHQSLEANHKTSINDSIKAIAEATAESKMSQKLGFQALSPNARQYLKNAVSSAFESQKEAVDSKITKSFTKATSDNKIIIEVEGAIEGNDIKLDLMAQTNIQTSFAVKTGVLIGQSVATQALVDVASRTTSLTESAGFDDLVREAGESLKGVIGAKGESDGETFRGFGEGLSAFGDSIAGIFSSIFSGLSLFLMIPLLLILGVLMFAPKLVEKFIPPKYRGMLILAAIVGIVLVVLFSLGSKSESRRFPVSSEFMSVDDDLADTLGYQVTTTKGKINKKPYEDFNFTAGGTWHLD